MMVKANEKKAREAFRHIFDPSTMDKDIEWAKKNIEWWENHRATVIEKCEDPKLRQKMEKSCNKAIEDSRKAIKSFEKIKAEKAKYRERFFKMLDDMSKGE